MSAWRGVSAQDGVSAWVCLPRGVSARGVSAPAHAGIHTLPPCGQNSSHTLVKTLLFCSFICGRQQEGITDSTDYIVHKFEHVGRGLSCKMRSMLNIRTCGAGTGSPAPVTRMTDRQTELRILPSHNFVDGRKQYCTIA